MDTVVTVSVVSDSPDDADKAIEAAFDRIESLEKMLSLYLPESEISHINKDAGKSPVRVSADVFELLSKAVYVSEMTGGAFDATIGAVSVLYDFHSSTMPPEEAITKNLVLVNYRDMILDKSASTVLLRKKGMLVDSGGIAKGFAADKAVDVLKKRGIQSGLVSVAGDIRTFGLKPDGKPWRIGIRNPRAAENRDEIIGAIELRDTAISTSGDYERFFMLEGQRYHHLLNPETGYPAQGCRSVSVIAGETAFSDAFATGAFILGPQKGLRLLQKMGFEGIIIDSNGAMSMTDGLRGKIEHKTSD
ncbi:MAG: FAD:protein FMN transferase [Nitrospirota bacterium]